LNSSYRASARKQPRCSSFARATLSGPIWSHLGEHPDPSQVPRHGSDNCMFRHGCTTSRCRTVPLRGLWIELGIEPTLYPVLCWLYLHSSVCAFTVILSQVWQIYCLLSFDRQAVLRIAMFSKLPSNLQLRRRHSSWSVCSYIHFTIARQLGLNAISWLGTLCADSTISQLSMFFFFSVPGNPCLSSIQSSGKSAITALSYSNESRCVAGSDS
jgi:hypothetical protein